MYFNGCTYNITSRRCQIDFETYPVVSEVYSGVPPGGLIDATPSIKAPVANALPTLVVAAKKAIAPSLPKVCFVEVFEHPLDLLGKNERLIYTSSKFCRLPSKLISADR